MVPCLEYAAQPPSGVAPGRSPENPVLCSLIGGTVGSWAWVPAGGGTESLTCCDSQEEEEQCVVHSSVLRALVGGSWVLDKVLDPGE